MNEKIYSLKLLSPTLCHGAEPTTAEMREPSIRGQLRRWHRLLWGIQDTNLCWGCVGKTEQGTAQASKAVLRLIQHEKEQYGVVSSLPHKSFDTRTSALLQGEYKLQVTFRYLKNDEKEKVMDHVDKTIRCWLLLGTIGKRGTRAFGSVWPLDNPPADAAQLKEQIDALLSEANCSYAYQISLRPCPVELKDCTDTLKGTENEKYFGYVKGKLRLTSPLKMKYVLLDNQYYLILHAAKVEIISGALKVLKTAGKPLPNYFL